MAPPDIHHPAHSNSSSSAASFNSDASEQTHSQNDVAKRKVQQTQTHLTEQRTRDLKYMLIVVFFSAISSFVLATTTVVMSRANGSSSALVVGLETLVGVAGGVFVFARFFNEYQGTGSVENITRFEQLGAQAEAILFMISAIVGIIDATLFLLRDEEDIFPMSKPMVLVLCLSVVQGVVQYVLQTRMARRLDSYLAEEDAVGALTGALMSLAAAGTSFIVQSQPELWWLDQALCLILSLMLLGFGVYFFLYSSHTIQEMAQVPSELHV